MNIYDVIAKLPFPKQQYIKYRFNLWYDTNKTMTEEEFLKTVNKKTMNSFHKWERTDEFKNIASMVLATKTAQDLIDMYEAVRDKAVKGDEKAVKLLLTLQKEIEHHKQQALKAFGNIVEQEEEDDDLEL
ncbi:hypothetical protein BAG01nite_12840 [Brevibacillus agri]|uniref:Uncharacterized protein n=1 Tax=Brevibacillus agri TaxID=51101 RepID=A0A3M8ASE0_9BACL|nr:hypothetical protein [Brevibacillus agri]MDN4094178.1 hypothetical protein [Brevibacillus agri]QAV13239.1 hypothetical protein BA6348_11040 [Brevibacillus agri]RNB54121.1 hypothetical protein EB820_14505 [Brevibacillus agri]GED25182.1 hypothetical protein BAG01nite_12840 [Brevibacillus agri]